MSQQTVTDRLTALRQKYIEQPVHNDNHLLDSPKSAKLKKKLMALEKERCQLKMANKDYQVIDQKIAHVKEAFVAKQEES